MNTALLDDIVSACAELHSLLSVCSPEDLPFTEYASTLENMLPKIGANTVSIEQLSASGYYKVNDGDNNQHKDKSEPKCNLRMYNGKQIESNTRSKFRLPQESFNNHTWANIFKDYHFGVGMEDENYQIDSNMHRSNSQELLNFLARYQFLNNDNTKNWYNTYSLQITYGLTLSITNQNVWDLRYTRPRGNATVSLQKVPLNNTYLASYLNYHRDTEVCDFGKGQVAILYIHNSKRLAALTFDLAETDPKFSGILDSKTGKTLKLDYSPEALAALGMHHHFISTEQLSTFTVETCDGKTVAIYAVDFAAKVLRFELSFENGPQNPQVTTKQFATVQASHPVDWYGMCCGLQTLVLVGRNQLPEGKTATDKQLFVVIDLPSAKQTTELSFHAAHPVHAMRLFVFHMARVLVCLDYNHKTWFHKLESQTIKKVAAPFANYREFVDKYNEEPYEFIWD